MRRKAAKELKKAIGYASDLQPEEKHKAYKYLKKIWKTMNTDSKARTIKKLRGIR